MIQVDQLLTICANAAITLGTVRSLGLAAKKIVRDHIGQLARLTQAAEDLTAAVARIEQRVSALEQLVQKGQP